MTQPLSTDAAAALLAVQGLASTPESADANARFTTLVLSKSAAAFSLLGFEDEPAGYTAALRQHSR
jgi:hypothetical protein